MKEHNIFGDAVSNCETKAFFRGEGRYFVRDPDWGEHVYAAHYGSWVEDFISQSRENILIFKKSLARFFSSLSVNNHDIDHCFGNVSAISYWKEQGALQEVDIFDTGTEEGTALAAYLSSLKNTKLPPDTENLISRHVAELDRRGHKLPVAIGD